MLFDEMIEQHSALLESYSELLKRYGDLLLKHEGCMPPTELYRPLVSFEEDDSFRK